MIIVLRIANPYIILRQITNLPQLRTSAATGPQLRTSVATGKAFCPLLLYSIIINGYRFHALNLAIISK